MSKEISREEVKKIDAHYREILNTETNHNDIIIKDGEVLRWQEVKEVRHFVDTHNLNNIVMGFHVCGHTKNNSELWRKLYRDIGYSLFGYWEIFFWTANNEDAAAYEPLEKTPTTEQVLDLLPRLLHAKPYKELSRAQKNALEEEGLLEFLYPNVGKAVAKKRDIPALLEKPNLEELIKMCDKHLKDIKNGEEDEDDERYIYEALMEALYGKNIFTWINEMTDLNDE